MPDALLLFRIDVIKIKRVPIVSKISRMNTGQQQQPTYVRVST